MGSFSAKRPPPPFHIELAQIGNMRAGCVNSPESMAKRRISPERTGVFTHPARHGGEISRWRIYVTDPLSALRSGSAEMCNRGRHVNCTTYVSQSCSGPPTFAVQHSGPGGLRYSVQYRWTAVLRECEIACFIAFVVDFQNANCTVQTFLTMLDLFSLEKWRR